MNEQLRVQIRDHFTTVQLTLLSIIVALVLENLLSAFWERELPGALSIATFLWWSQAALVFLSALSTWSGFALGLSTAQRSVTFVDIIAPFALLIALDLAIGFMHPASVAAYLLAIGSASLIAAFMLLIDVRGGNSPGRAMELQLALGVLDCIGAAAVWLELLDLRGAFALITFVGIGQALGLAGSIRGWREAT